jgi:CheY-like chemotaxis protein
MVAVVTEVVAGWRGGGFDLILMDIQMPVMDGVEATQIIRAAEAEEDLPRIPIVALTANALVHQVEQYAAAGMDGHVSKPIELPRLYDAIDRAFNAAARAEAARAA